MLQVLVLLFFTSWTLISFKVCGNNERAACQKDVYHVAVRNTDCAIYLMKSDECLAVLTSNIPKTP